MPATVTGIDVLGLFLAQLTSNIENLQRDVLSWVNSDVIPLAQERTHRITGKLKAGWRAEPRGTNIAIYNLMGYAGGEFARRGVKTRGTQQDIGTPHDPRPAIVDFIDAQIQGVILESLFRGTRR